MVDGGQAVAVVDGQCVQYGLPAVDPAGRVAPVFPPLDRGEIQDLDRGLLGGETTSPDGCFPEPRIEALDRVCAVNDFAELDSDLPQCFLLAKRRLFRTRWTTQS